MWTLVVVLILTPADFTYLRASALFATRADCEYALSFAEAGHYGDWALSYAACEPRSAA